jgi:hypothetical protein
MHSRPPFWEHRLAAAIAAARERPFVWGWHDCPTFTFETRTALTGGPDTATLWRGRYHCHLGGQRLLRRLGWRSLAEMGCDLLGAPLPTPMLAQRGDIVLGPEARGFGICVGSHALGMAPAGLTAVALQDCTFAWRV